MTAILMLLRTLGMNLIGMLLTKKMIIWALEYATKQSSNKIDDNAVVIIKSLYENDIDKVQEGVEGLTEAIKEYRKEK